MIGGMPFSCREGYRLRRPNGSYCLLFLWRCSYKLRRWSHNSIEGNTSTNNYSTLISLFLFSLLASAPESVQELVVQHVYHSLVLLSRKRSVRSLHYSNTIAVTAMTKTRIVPDSFGRVFVGTRVSISIHFPRWSRGASRQVWRYRSCGGCWLESSDHSHHLSSNLKSWDWRQHSRRMSITEMKGCALIPQSHHRVTSSSSASMSLSMTTMKTSVGELWPLQFHLQKGDRDVWEKNDHPDWPCERLEAHLSIALLLF